MGKVVGNTYLTLMDKYNQTEGEGNITSTIIDLFSETNVLIEDATVVECNSGEYHKTSVRTGLPDVEFRKFYQGVSSSKGEYAQIVESTSMMEAYSEVDKALADLNGNTNQFRLNESRAFIESMNQKIQTYLFYGTKDVDACSFDGFSNRYNKINEDPTDNKTIGHFVLNGGGTGNDNTSIWLMTWGNLHSHLIYPKGTKGGLQHEDMGQKTLKDAEGKQFEGYREHYTWNVGLAVRDFRSTARVANIDVNDLEGSNTVDLSKLMIKAFHRTNRYAKTGKSVFYVNEQVYTALHIQAANKSNVLLSLKEFGGEPIVMFLNVPVKCCDQILNTESKVPVVSAYALAA